MQDMKFNLQTFLSEMREESRSDLQTLAEKVDTVLEKVNDHETRIVVVENTRKSVRWLGVTMIGALVVGAIDFAYEHLPHLLAANP